LPPLDLGIPLILTWLPALVLAREVGWKRRFRLGWLLAAGYEVILHFFLAPTIENMTGLPFAAGLGVVALYAAWHGLIGAVFLALAEPVRRVAERRWLPLGVIAVAALFASLEAAWPRVFTASIGRGFWEIGPIHATAALTGVAGLTFMALLVSAGLADYWVQRSPRRLVPAAALLAALLTFGVGWHLHATGAEPDRVLRVAIVQPNYTLEEKRRAAGRIDPGQASVQRVRFFHRIERHLRGLAPDTWDLVVASEGSFPFYWYVEADERAPGEHTGATEATARIQRAIAEGPRTHTIIGGLRLGDDGRVRNTAVHFGPDGEIRGHYDKQTLMPFSEYVPGRDLFAGLSGAVPGISNVYAGDTPCAFDLDGVRVACGICYETVFTGKTREDVGDAELLINLTIDTWFGATNAPESHLMVQTSRAAELGVPLVRAALSGISAVVDADGVARRRLELGVEGVLAAEVPLRALSAPYRTVGPAFAWLLGLLTLGLLVDAFRHRQELFPPTVVRPPRPPA
jgi:apolipoprotein N-acyltransferase